jgi:hypothetical protein
MGFSLQCFFLIPVRSPVLHTVRTAVATFRDAISGNLLEDAEVLSWLLTHLEDALIDEASASMLTRLLRDTKLALIVFCKYIAYAIIALTHTCYLIKNYAPDELKKFLPVQNVRGLAQET